MNSSVRLTRKRLAVLGALVVLAAAGAAYATIPDSAGVYTACELKTTGTIRLIDPSLGSSSLLGIAPRSRCSSRGTNAARTGRTGSARPSRS